MITFNFIFLVYTDLILPLLFFGGAAYAGNSGSNSRISRHAHNFRSGFSCHIPAGDYHVTDRTQLVQNHMGCHNTKKTAYAHSKGFVPRFQQEALIDVLECGQKRLLEFEQPFLNTLTRLAYGLSSYGRMENNYWHVYSDTDIFFLKFYTELLNIHILI